MRRIKRRWRGRIAGGRTVGYGGRPLLRVEMRVDKEEGGSEVGGGSGWISNASVLLQDLRPICGSLAFITLTLIARRIALDGLRG